MKIPSLYSQPHPLVNPMSELLSPPVFLDAHVYVMLNYYVGVK
jgi:hypothetical protein